MIRTSKTIGSPVCCSIAAALLLVVGFATPGEAQSRAGSSPSSRNILQVHQRSHRELRQKLAGSLEELARFCDEKQFTEAAAKIRRLAVPAQAQEFQVDLLPKQVQPEIPLDLSADERYWRSQLRRFQKLYAKDLYLLSRRVLKAGYPSYVYHLVREVAYHDPDHKSARRLLGYVRYGNEWITPFASQMTRRRMVWHDKFGWLRSADVAKYEKGERKFGQRWMSAAQEAAIRQDFDKHPWEVGTDHYLIKTNHSLERGVEVAVALESFYGFFFQTFAGFFNTPEQLEKLFEGATGGSRSRATAKPFEVHYYRSRDEYNRRLKLKIPQIEITNGLYYTTDRTAYFYHDPASTNEATLYHEAAHQLFYESEPRDRPIAVNGNFWIVEGIACYVESFQRKNGRFSLGDPEYVRFRNGRYRYLNDDYYVPLAQFARMGMQAFQTDEKIKENYSQASNLAHFFMHYDDGQYRDAVIEHLSQIYGARRHRLAGVQSLAELTGVDFAQLDRQYGEYVKRTAAAAAE